MPYELLLTKRVAVTDVDRYFNPCCIGGDQVLERLLPALRATYPDIRSGQEDWGWFAWFDGSGQSFAVDIFTDDPEQGHFRLFITARRKRRILPDQIVDSPELSQLVDGVQERLTGWAEQGPTLQLLDGDYNPMRAEG